MSVVVVGASTTLLATLLWRRFVVADALFPVGVVVVAFVVALQVLVVLGAGSRVRVFHDGELGAGQVVVA